jgi:hypothetical protein
MLICTCLQSNLCGTAPQLASQHNISAVLHGTIAVKAMLVHGTDCSVRSTILHCGWQFEGTLDVLGQVWPYPMPKPQVATVPVCHHKYPVVEPTKARGLV